jgi:hypothetical protein
MDSRLGPTDVTHAANASEIRDITASPEPRRICVPAVRLSPKLLNKTAIPTTCRSRLAGVEVSNKASAYNLEEMNRWQIGRALKVAGEDRGQQPRE